MASTISLSNEMKEKIKLLGHAGESYEDVIKRMYEISSKQILKNYLYDTSDSVTVAQMRDKL